MMRLKTDHSILSEIRKTSVFYGAAFFLPAVLMLGICVIMKITPFGDGSFLIADMQKQYSDYFAYYKTLFSGENNILYTFSKCLGGDMIGFFTYYLTSPFNLLFLVTDNGHIPAGITVVIVLKTGFCGVSMAYYLSKRFLKQVSPSVLLFSTSYAMSGYLMTNSFNVMWLDALVFLPLVLWGIEKLLLGERPYFYIAALFMVLFCNYYIGYMVCIFCVFYFGCRLLVPGEKEGLLRKLWRFAYGSLLAAGLLAVLLLPTLCTLQGSLKDGQDLDAGITLPNLNPVRVMSKLFTMAFNEHELMNGMPNIFCGLLMFVLTVLFFFNKKIPAKERFLSGILMGIVMGSFCRAEVDFVWHAFMEPSGYHYRYAFLFSFLMIVYSYQGFLQLETGMEGKRFFYAAGIFVLLFFFIFHHRYTYLDAKKALPDMILILGMLPVLFFMKQKRGYKKLFLLLAALQLFDLTLNGAYVYMKLRNTSYISAVSYRQEDARIAPAVEAVKADGGVYRMENLNPKNDNDSMHFSYAGLTHYSSNEKNFVLFFLERMGLNYNRLYAEYGTGTTQTVDSLCGIKYLLGTKESINKPYVPVWEHQGGLTAYENPYALPLGFLADPKIRLTDMGKEDPFALQNAMYGGAAGENREILKDAVIRNRKLENCAEEKEAGVSYFQRKEDGQPVRVTYEVETAGDGRVYAYLTAKGMTQPAEVYVNGTFLCGYLNRSNWKILNLGEYKKGEEISFTVQADRDTLAIEEAYFVTEDETVLKEGYEKIMRDPVSVERKSSSALSVETESGEDRILVFSIPYEEDWQVKVDGKRVFQEKVYDTFLAVPLKAGSHRVEISYIPKGIFAGAVISLICAGILLGMIFTERRRGTLKALEERGKEQNDGEMDRYSRG